MRDIQVCGEDETLDELRDFDLRIIQKRRGYRFSVDPLLLCGFVSGSPAERIADLGTGCGVIPLVLARTFPAAKIVGIEVQPELAGLAERNVALNRLDDRIEVVCSDILHLRERYPASSFDLITANPPFRARGTGKVSPVAGRDAARHETTAGLADFLSAARHLVGVSGRISLVHHASRLGECLAEGARLSLAPLRLQFVHGTPEADGKMFLVEFVKGRGGELRILPPLYTRGDFRPPAPGQV